ncbi:MAG: hypothetical protein KC496_06415 [Anaerolineae bacterium]|nr:hypothetical protein [Anaerolineae bacterium]
MDDETRQHLTEVQAKYSELLMSKANVIGVGIGYARVNGELTDVPAIVALVQNKLPLSALATEDIIPPTLDDMRVDVQETGAINAF